MSRKIKKSSVVVTLVAACVKCGWQRQHPQQEKFVWHGAYHRRKPETDARALLLQEARDHVRRRERWHRVEIEEVKKFVLEQA